MKTMVEVFQHFAKENHQSIALTWNGKTVSYAEFKEAISRLANALRAHGINKGDRLIIMLPNIPQFPIIYYAGLIIGAVIVPINIMLKSREIAFLLDDAEAKAIVAWDGFADEVLKAVTGMEALKHTIFLGDQHIENTLDLTELITSGSVEEIPVEVEEDDVALVLYTSGVTGRPKGAEIMHKSLTYHLEEIQAIFRFTSADRFLAVHPFFQPMGQAMMMNTALAAGANLILQPRFHPADVLSAIQDNSITVFLGVPSMYRIIMKFPSIEKYDLKSLRYAISGGSAFPDELMEEFGKLFQVPLLEGYGLSEAYSFVAVNQMKRGPRKGSVGLALHGLEVKIFNDSDEEIAIDEVGEIVVQGPTVMKGYLNRPEATGIALRNGWLHTGDVGRIDFDGYLHLVDRKNDVIIKGGFKIFPREIEAVLEGLPHIQEVAVIGIPDDDAGEEIKACVVLKPGAQITSGEIQEYCKEKMAPYKSPKMVRFYRELPKTPTGKILKEDLRKS
jgi:long-chain acyl-CoA synthetase